MSQAKSSLSPAFIKHFSLLVNAHGAAVRWCLKIVDDNKFDVKLTMS